MTDERAKALEKYEAGLIPDPRVKALAAELAAVAERAAGEGKDPLEAMAARCLELIDEAVDDGPGSPPEHYTKNGLGYSVDDGTIAPTYGRKPWSW